MRDHLVPPLLAPLLALTVLWAWAQSALSVEQGKEATPRQGQASDPGPELVNPTFSKIGNDRTPIGWRLGPGTTIAETGYLADTYYLATSSDHLMATQDLDFREVAGKTYELAVTARGEGDAQLGLVVTCETHEGRTQELRAFWDQPLVGTFSTYLREIAVPKDTRRIASVKLYRSNQRGALHCREVRLSEMSGFRDVKEARHINPEHCWPVGEPFVSPGGIQWGRPLRGGPLDILIILNGRVARMSVELGQRLDLRADTICISDYVGVPYAWGVAGRINAKLAPNQRVGAGQAGVERPYDVIILAETLKSKPLAQAIEKNVAQGAGLVVIHSLDDASSVSLLEGALPETKDLTQDEPDMMRRVPWRYLPATRSGGRVLKRVGIGSHGRGRVVSLAYSGRIKGIMPDGFGLIEGSSELDPWWEYVYSLVGKSVLWCANRTMPAVIDKVRIDAEKGTLEVLVGAREAFSGGLSLAWAKKYFDVKASETKPQVSVRGGEKVAVEFQVPEAIRRYNGVHVANIFLKDKEGRAVDWATGTFVVKGNVTIGDRHPFARDWYAKGQAIAGSVSVENRSGNRAELNVKGELVDYYGRSIWSESRSIVVAPGEAAQVPIAPSVDRALTAYHRLRVTASDQRHVLDAREWVFLLPDQFKRALDDFRFGASANYYYETHVDDACSAYLQGIGATFSSEGGPFGGAPRLNMPWHFMTLGGPLLHNKNGKSPVRSNCFSNPQVIGQIVEHAARVYPMVRRNGAVFCTLADEAELVKDGRVETCFCPLCAAGFREWAKRTYGGLGKASAEWGTAFRSWDDAGPITADEARKRGNFAQWADFRTYMEDTLIGLLVAVQVGVKRQDPASLIGYANPFVLNPFSGADHYKMAKTETAFAKYMRPDLMKEYVSFNPAAPAHTYYGYGERPAWCGWYPWWFAMNGGDLLVWWDPFGGSHPILGLFDCFGRQTERSLATLASVRDLLTGVGKIFHDFPAVRNPIAILYSQPSMHVAWAESGMKVGEAPWGEKGMYQWAETAPLHSFKLYCRSTENFKALVKETWLQPDFIASEQILAGRLNNYQVLMLPYAGALSEDVLSRIADFVRNGGMVLADLRTGVYTEHGRPLASRPSFEALFGAKRLSGKFDPGIAAISYSGTFASVPVGKDLDQAAGKEPLEATFGQVMARHPDGTPAVIVNTYGKGKAVYLNFVPGNGLASTALMRQILELTGVRREAIVTKGRNPAIGYECFLYERGPIRYIGLLRDLPPQPVGGRLSWHGHQFRHATTEKETVALGLPAEREVYEVRTGKHLGRTASVSLEMGPAEAKVLGLLPYRVTEIAIGELKPRYRPGEEVKYKAAVAVSKGKAGDHVLRLEVFDPDGRLVPCYTKNVLAASGRYDDSVPLVLNEKAGPWTIKVTDVTTKVSKSAAFEVNVTDH